ncbi:hypothetical protein MYCTH_2306934 [Thermothelomyces thermophilus ATCC 42464]|uniref:Tudor domain-containing protein n=1 Tax=Thermothelomyces thermophilus (strain ATCC 42464 / BCRC 31852 / DSM 1799) TaxID=573729 RepID=G2QF04_THET4|nr:uncharacterized protein MYCTH_2306934 [Thermothelomyces thermophilus ATCC 42464]AEO59033.1 hypothetical protein MYCTH_2306934 [Thermothelomyces thermophilus ATCC 42464]
MSAQLEAERKEYENQLELVVTSLKDDPDNAELQALKGELEQMIQLLDDSLAELKPKNEPPKAAPQKAPSPPPAEQKWSRENHPAFKKAAPASEEKEKEAETITYQVNDNVMAKWLSGDKGFYPARITAVTGSSTAPIYTVKFKNYDTVETLRAKDIRPMAQKRKADGTAVSGNSNAVGGPTSTATPSPASLTPTSANNGIVMSAAADIYPQALEAKRAAAAAAAAENADDKPRPKFKKIKATKELEKGKTKWQEFTSKGKFGKVAKKESMFRTPEGINGRVGFTGSGQAMRKDPARTRHVYQPNEDLD